MTSSRFVGGVDELSGRLGGRHEAAGDGLQERDRDRARVRLGGEVLGEVARQRPSVAAEAHQEQRLRLADDVPGDAHHDVVELAVREVVLDPGASRPGHGAVDHVELAVVGPADIVLAPVERAVVGVEAVLVPGKEVVDDDLRAGVGEPW